MQSKTPSNYRQSDAPDANRRLLIEQMEERVLFDAVPLAPVDAAVDADLLTQLDSATQAVTADTSIGDHQQQDERPREIVFVDKSVEGFNEIVSEFVAQRDVEVFFINDGSAGLEQIANHLKGRNDLNAIHIVSHGNNAQLNLGNSVIGTASLSSQYLSELVRIGQSLNEHGDILIYGCDLASSASGEAFIKEFSALTNADVAASDDITGAASEGGDWDLEKQTGSIEAKTLSSNSFEGRLIVTDAGFTVGTAPNLGAGEVAVVPVGQPGTSSYTYSNSATAGGGAISIDVRLTLVNTFDELGNLTNGTADQMPVTFGNWAGSPIVLSRVVGSSVSGYEGHTAEILVEFFDNATGNPLSVVGDFTFQDIDFNLPGLGGGAEAIRVKSDEMASYSLSSTPATEIDVIDNGDGTTSFTNDSSAGGENDQQRWVSIRFYDTPSLTLFFDARNSHTGYGLSTKNFSATPISFAQPDATDDDFTTDQDTSIAGNVIAANNGNGIDSDPDGDPLSVSLVNGSPANVGNSISGSNGGQFVINSNGSFTFDPNGEFDNLAAGESIATTITYQVNDATGLADTATVSVVVTGTNDNPTPVGSIPNQFDNDGESIAPLDVSGNFADTDTTDTFTFSDGGTLPPGLSINPLTGIISGIIDNSASVSGPFAVVITANDGNGGIVSQTFTWTVANPAPVATSNAGNVKEDTDLTDSGNVIVDNDGSGVDSDPDSDPLFVSAVNGLAGNVGVGLSGSYGSIVINATGAYTYTLDNSNPAVSALDNGETLADSFTYTVSDGEGGSSTATVTITIAGTNDSPIVGSTLPNQTGQDAATITPLSITSAFSDPDGDTLTYTATNLPPGLTIDAAGLITGTLTSDASQNAPGGVFTVTVTATDDNGASVSTTFAWTITNPVPNAINDANSTNQSTTALGNVLSNDSDPDGDTILVNAVAGSAANVGNVVVGSNGGQFTINGNGSYTFNPNGDFDSLADGEVTTTSVAYTITDNQGGTGTATLTLTITGSNDDPVNSGAIPSQTGLDSDTVVGLNISSFFSDPDITDSLTFIAAGLPTGLSMDASGNISGIIDNSASQGGPASDGVYFITVTANDGNGGTVSQSFNWTVTNPAPIANDDTDATDQDTSVAGTVFSNDSDPDGDTITVTGVGPLGGESPANVGVSFTGIGGGAFVVNSDGSYSFDPNGDFDSLAVGETANTTVFYQIQDEDGAAMAASLVVTVTGTNDDPGIVATIPDQASLDAQTIATFDVSSFFSDVDASDTLTFSAAGLPPGLSINAAGQITGTVDNSASQSGPFTVSVTANDGNGGTISQSFSWTVSNPGPTALNDSVATDQASIISGDVFSNDSDPDSDTISVNAVNASGPSVGNPVTGSNGGSFTINSDGSYSFNPGGDFTYLAAGETLSTSVSYTITDSEGGTDSATLTVLVSGLNDDPIAVGTIPDQLNSDAETITAIDISGFFGDGDLVDTLTFSASGLPTGLSIDASGNISGTIDHSASQGGPYAVTITASDGNGGTVFQSFAWTVTNPGPTAADDSGATDQDTTTSGIVVSNDSDPDGDNITVVSVNGLTGNVANAVAGDNGGLFTMNANGSYSFDPAGAFDNLAVGELATTQVTYEISDSEGGTATAILEITVTGTNQDPTIVATIPDQSNADNETIVALDVSSFFTDVDTSDSLNFTALGLPTGLSINPATGQITGTVDNSASSSGPYLVTISAADGNGGVVAQSFNWIITNPAPTATANSGNVTEDGMLSDSGNVISDDDGFGFDTDPDGDPLNVNAVNGSGASVNVSTAGSYGSIVINSDGTYTYTLDNNNATVNALDNLETLTESFSYTISDGQGGTSTANITITINGSNDDPEIVGSMPNQAGLDGETIASVDVASFFTDPDGDPLSFSAVGLPPGLAMAVNGRITGTLDNSASQAAPGGIFTVTVTATDDNGDTVSDTFTWTVSNPTPTAQDNTASVTEDTDLSDSGNVIADNDGSGVDSDPDADTLQVSAVEGNAANVGVTVWGTYGQLIINSSGDYTYTLDNTNPDVSALDVGGALSESFSYTISDGEGGTSSATLTITINGSNDAPIAGAMIPNQFAVDAQAIAALDASVYFSDPDGDTLTFSSSGLPLGISIDPITGEITGTPDSSASQGGTGGVYTVSITATDDNGQSVTTGFDWTVTNPAPIANDDSFSTDEDTAVSGTVAGNDSDADDTFSFSQLTSPTNGSLTFNSDGSFNYDPDPEFNGSDSFVYQIVDADGAAATATVTIAVNPVNDVPVVITPVPDQVNSDSDTIILDVAANFTDVEGNGLTFSATGLPSGLSINAAGTITGTIDSSASASGPYTVVVTVVDGNGGSVSDTFTWTVTNTVPTATDDSFSTDEDTPVTGMVATNDADSDGDSLTFAQASNPANGSVVMAANGTFTYTPDPDFNGTDSFDYEVTDSEGATVTATVTITVDPVNDAPVVDANIPDQASLDNDTVSLDVSSNFSDVDGNGLTFTAVGLPTGLSIDTGGNITGMIASSASVSGPYTVVIMADDGNGGTATDTFTWNITNPAPVATDDSYATSEGIPIFNTVATNDIDSDGDSLTYTPLSSPTNGTVAFALDGSFTYTPNALFNGSDSFTYLVTDADGLTSSATVTITIFPVDDFPVVDTNVADQINFDSDSVSLDVSGNFSDPDGDSLSFSATGLPSGLSIDAAGNISGTIDSSASLSGPFTVVITADDGKGGTVTDTFTWSVTNPVPVANDDAFTTNEDTPISASVTGNDSDPDGDSVSFVQLTSPGNGSLTFDPAGNFTYTPDADFSGTDSFDYAIVDADGAVTPATVYLNVDAVNDPPMVDSPIADQVNLDGDSISLDVSLNFTDVEGDGLTFSATGLPSGLSMDAAGIIAGTIDSDASASGPFTVVVTVSDGNGGSVTDTFTWFVNNPPPVATDNAAVVTEDSVPVAVGNVIHDDSGSGVDADPDGDTLFASSIEGNAANVGVTIGGTYGTIRINADGSYVYAVDDLNPAVDALDDTETLTESFSYEISDGNGGASSAVLTITINGSNDVPFVGGTIADQSNQDADSVVAFDVSSAFGDVDGDPLTYVVNGLPSGLTIDFATGLISGLIAGNASVGGPTGDGVYNVTVTATDDNGQSVSTTFTWTIGNPVPVAGDDSFTTNEDTPFSSSVTANDNDLDNDVVSYSVTSAPTNGSLTFAADGSFTYIPNADFFGTDSFDYELCDADGDCSTATVTIDVVSVNDDPTLDSPLPDQSGFDSELINLDISSHFGDPEGGPLAFSATGLPTGLSMDAAGNITGTVDSSASAGDPYHVAVTAEDAFGAKVTGTFTWIVTNPSPNATNDSFFIDEDTSLSATVGTNDSDPDGDTVTFNLVSGATNGALVFNPDGSFDYTPNSGFNGLDSFDYEIVDADGAVSAATAVISVGAVNDLPVITVPIPDQTNLDSEVVNQDISGNFSDPDGDTMTFTATGLPPGLSMDPLTGEITGTLDSSASIGSTYTIVVTANDGNGGIISETFSWTVENLTPVAGDDNFTTDEDVPVAGTVAGNDNDLDGDAVSYNLTSGATNGVVSLTIDGSFTYIPNPDFFGTDSFEYEICDVDGACAVATVSVTVAPINDDPTSVTPIPNQANFDSDLVNFDASGFFSDVDGDLLTFSANNLPTGLVISPGGLISGTIDSSASQSGPFTVEIIANDGSGTTVGQFFTWNVTNPAPTAGDDTLATAEDTAVSGSVSVNDSDPDSDDTTYSLTANPTDGSVSFNSDGTFTYTPDADFFGVDSFEYELCDADGACTTAIVTITVTSVNDAPSGATPIADQTNFDADSIVFDLSSSFFDLENDSLTFTGTGLPPGLILDPVTGMISGTIDSSASTTGPYTVVITVVDGNGGTVTDTFTWSVVNPAPVAQDDTFATSEDVPVSGTVSTNDSDADDSVTFSLTSLPSNGVVIFNSDGSFTYTPDTDYVGIDSFEYELCDADGACVGAFATIVIGSVNDPPIVNSPTPDQMNFDADSVVLDVGSVFTDPEGDSLTFAATGLPPGLSINPVSGIISGVLDPSASVIGTYIVVVTADDGNGGSSNDTFTWTVSNPLPVATNDNFTTPEDTAVGGSIAGNDFDPDGDMLSFSLTGGPSHGMLTFNGNGTFNYTPNANFFGTDSFSYQVTDADGDTSTAVATISITPVNDGPMAIADATTTFEDTPVNIAVLSNDSDSESDPLTVTIVNAPANGFVTVNPDGSIDYTPDKDFYGTDSFDYEICDAGGLCSTATVTVNVSPVNDAPFATDDAFTTVEDTTIVGSLATNDSDPEGDSLTYSLVTPPTQGTLTLNPDGTFVYSPEPDFNGIVTFGYRLTDPSGATDIGLATINVTPSNDPPVALDDNGSTTEDAVVTINLLGNDFDPESDALFVTHINGIPVSPGGTVGLSSGASVTLKADGTVEYNPHGSFDGLEDGSSAIDSFLYTVSDGHGGNAMAETVVTINGENDPPIAEDDYIKVTVDTSIKFAVLANDTDPEGDPLAVVLLNNPAGGTASVNPDGTISFVPDPGFEGIVHIHYLVEDPSGATSDATLTIEIEPEFRFDAFTNFSVSHLSRGQVSDAPHPSDRMLTKQIFSLAPEPIFSGYARPGTQIIGRIYDASGTLLGEASANTDPGGNWLVQFQGTRGHQFYRIEFEQIAAVGTADIYGYFGLHPADNSYQAMESLTEYENPLSIEAALFDSFLDLQQSYQQADNPLGFGRPDATP